MIGTMTRVLKSSLGVRACAVAIVAVGAVAGGASGQQHPMVERGEFVPHHVDSGPIAHPGMDVLGDGAFSHLVFTENARWTRLFFAEVTLEADSIIRFTSLLDGQTQELDARGIEMWSNTSAFFNGDAVLVELIPGEGTRNNRFVLEEVAVEIIGSEIGNHCTPPLQCGICGQDDRVPSNENWAPRLLLPSGGGCSAAIIGPTSCAVTAGHCIGGSMTLQFNVPQSNPDCSLNHPPVEDQFPVTGQISQNGGVGADWGVLTSGTNNLGQTAYDRYGEYRPIASSIPSSGSAEVWGYGVSDSCVLGQSQQYSFGNINSLSSSAITYTADVTCGNSGSALLHNDEIIGIVTHCSWDCPFDGNIATRVDVSAFANARDQLCPEPVENDTCQDAIVVSEGQTPFTNLGATTSGPSEPADCTFDGDGNIQRDVWFEYTATCTGDLTISLCDGEQPQPGGECQGFCGGQAPSGCWCDDACDGFNDCCVDVCDDCPDLTFCSGGGGECAGHCGGSAPSGCWCDDACDSFNDCCPGVCDDCPNLTFCTGGLTTGGAATGGFDTKLAVYGSACPTSSGSVIACNKDACGALSEVTISAVAGETYKLRIGGHNGEGGEGILTITCDGVEPPDDDCPADFNDDGEVNVLDLLQVLEAWGPCPGCDEDLNDDDVVDVLDLLQVLEQWGPCS